MAANMSLYINPGYDFEKKELIAVANIASTPNVILAGSWLKVKGLLDMKDVQEKLAAVGFSIENQSPDILQKLSRLKLLIGNRCSSPLALSRSEVLRPPFK